MTPAKPATGKSAAARRGRQDDEPTPRLDWCVTIHGSAKPGDVAQTIENWKIAPPPPRATGGNVVHTVVDWKAEPPPARLTVDFAMSVTHWILSKRFQMRCSATLFGTRNLTGKGQFR